jgi:hypothetical protein
MKRRYNLCIRGHLGLGDTIITAPIVREKASIYDLVCVLAKHHNLSSTEYLFRDVPNVVVRGVLDDQDADFFAGTVWKDEVLRIGMFGEGYDPTSWDTSMYLQAGVEFSDRWNKWTCVRDEAAEERVFRYATDDVKRMIFIHDDRSRGITIDEKRPEISATFEQWAKREVTVVVPIPVVTPILFHWRKVIEACDEIHAIPSSFAAFIDSIDLPKNPKLYLHHYVRGNEPLCKLGKAWEILT